MSTCHEQCNDDCATNDGQPQQIAADCANVWSQLIDDCSIKLQLPVGCLLARLSQDDQIPKSLVSARQHSSDPPLVDPQPARTCKSGINLKSFWSEKRVLRKEKRTIGSTKDQLVPRSMALRLPGSRGDVYFDISSNLRGRFSLRKRCRIRSFRQVYQHWWWRIRLRAWPRIVGNRCTVLKWRVLTNSDNRISCTKVSVYHAVARRRSMITALLVYNLPIEGD